MLETSEAESSFILRTHGEEVEEIEGGSFERIEENAYLICAEDTTVKIQVEAPDLSDYSGKNQCTVSFIFSITTLILQGRRMIRCSSIID